MDEEKERNKLLLELAFHIYEEEERRNQLIDSKNQSFVAFLGVMFTIQVTIVSNFNSMFDNVSSNRLDFLLLLFLLSILCYIISLMFFSLTLMFTDKFQSAPPIDKIIEFGNPTPCSEKDNNFIMSNTIVSLRKCIFDNDKIMENKTRKGNFGFLFLNVGVIFTILFILYYLFSTLWCCYV